ncbi:MAG TPA: hypothetical protein VF547_09660 [Allosphingosinicella sp.]
MPVAKRHLAVFLLFLVAAATVSFLMPLDVDSKDVFSYFMLGFMAYLALSYAATLLWPRKQRP